MSHKFVAKRWGTESLSTSQTSCFCNSTGTTRTDFILSAARRTAEEALLDQAVLSVSPEAYAEFLARLDAPPQANERLRKTMQAQPPWEPI